MLLQGQWYKQLPSTWLTSAEQLDNNHLTEGHSLLVHNLKLAIDGQLSSNLV